MQAFGPVRRAMISSLGLWRWMDGSWSYRGFEPEFLNTLLCGGASGEYMWVTTFSGVYPISVSTDAGETWTGGGIGLPPGSSLEELGADRASPCVLYGSRFAQDSIYRSTDQGRHWQSWGTGHGSTGSFGDFAVSPLGCNGAACLSAGMSLALWRTSSTGSTWQQDFGYPILDDDWRGGVEVSGAYPNAVFVVTGPRLKHDVDGVWTTHELPASHRWSALSIPEWNPRRIFVAGLPRVPGAARVLYSDDLGSTWVELSSGLEGLTVSPASSILLTAGRDRRLYLTITRPAQVLLHIDPAPASAAEPELAFVQSRLAVCPNPMSFTDRVLKIRTAWGSTPRSIARVARISDVQGRLVAAVAMRGEDGQLQALWDGKDATGRRVQAGVYRIDAGPFGATSVIVVPVR
ncbi:MAG: hypothetical protein U0527_06785 [Candidatus Eisenbacteria bacterium]